MADIGTVKIQISSPWKTKIAMMMAVFCVVEPYGLVEVYRRAAFIIRDNATTQKTAILIGTALRTSNITEIR